MLLRRTPSIAGSPVVYPSGFCPNGRDGLTKMRVAGAKSLRITPFSSATNQIAQILVSNSQLQNKTYIRIRTKMGSSSENGKLTQIPGAVLVNRRSLLESATRMSALIAGGAWRPTSVGYFQSQHSNDSQSLTQKLSYLAPCLRSIPSLAQSGHQVVCRVSRVRSQFPFFRLSLRNQAMFAVAIGPTPTQ